LENISTGDNEKENDRLQLTVDAVHMVSVSA
jgi:hypothetical protein